MRSLHRFLIRLRNLVTGQRGDARLREEMEDYVEREAEANIQAGMSEDEARRQARMKLGAAEAIREQYHAEEGLPFLECLAQDTRFALRQMRRAPGFTWMVVLTMALGIAATTTMFTVVYSTLPAVSACREDPCDSRHEDHGTLSGRSDDGSAIL